MRVVPARYMQCHLKMPFDSHRNKKLKVLEPIWIHYTPPCVVSRAVLPHTMPKPQSNNQWSPDVIIYTDAAVDTNGSTAVSYRLTTETGTVIDEDGYVLGESYRSHIAEYIAVLKAISIAKDHGYEDPVIYTDYEGIIEHVFGEASPSDEKQENLKDKIVSVLRSQFNKWMLEYLPRDQNEQAHDLANQAMKNGVATGT